MKKKKLDVKNFVTHIFFCDSGIHKTPKILIPEFYLEYVHS